MIDLQLPQPLLEPGRWLFPTEGEPTLFGLDVFQYGGPLAARLRDAIELGSRVLFAAPLDFWAGGRDLAFPEDISRFTIVTPAELAPGEREVWLKFARDEIAEVAFAVDRALVLPNVHDWSKAVFPQTSRTMNELEWRRRVTDYVSQVRGSGLDLFRYFAGYLRTEIAALEWARVSALYSPQNTAARGSEAFVVNPSLSIVGARAVWRAGGLRLCERDLAWQDGAAIDELRDHVRLTRDQLVTALTSRGFPLRVVRPFGDVVDGLISEGILL